MLFETVIIFHNITVFTAFLNQINTALVSIYFFQKLYKKSYWAQTFEHFEILAFSWTDGVSLERNNLIAKNRR